MEEYKPPYTITEKMLNLVSSISTKLGRRHLERIIWSLH